MFTGLTGGGVGDIVGFVKFSGIDQANADLDRLNAKVSNASQVMNKTLNITMLAGAAAMGAAAIASIKFESAFAGVTKTVEGLRDPMGKLTAEGEAMAKSIRGISLETPIAVGELARIGELGGQLGIARGDLTSFIDTISKIAVTTDLTIESASTDMARFVNITKQVAPEGMTAAMQIERLGSTVVDLGNNLATTESEILSMGMRLAGAGNQIGLSQAEILGLSGALSSVGLEAQMGGTAISKAMIEMANSVAVGGPKLEAFADAARMSSDEFANLFKEDAAAAITAFITGLGDVSETGGNTFAVLEDLGFSEIRLRDALLRASSASDLFSKSIQMGSDAYVENNALNKEAAQRFGTTESQLKILKNIIVDTFISIGNDFVPVLNDMLTAFNQHPEAIQSVIKVLGKATIAIGGLAVATKAYLLVAKLAGINTAGFAAAFGPIGLVIAGVTVAMAALKEINDKYYAKQIETIQATSDEIEEMDALAKIIGESEKVTVDVWRAQEDFEEALRKVGIEANVTRENVRELNEQYRKMREESINAQIADLKIKLDSLNQNLGVAAGYLGNVYNSTDEWERKLAALEAELLELNPPLEETVTNTDELAGAMEDEALAVKALNDPFAEMLKTMEDGVEPIQSLRDQFHIIKEETALWSDQIKGVPGKIVDVGTAADGANKPLEYEVGLWGQLVHEIKTGEGTLVKDAALVFNIAGKLGIFNEETKTAIDKTVSLVASFNTLSTTGQILSGISLGIDLLSYGYDLLFGSAERIPMTLEDVTAHFDTMGISIDNIQANLEALNAEFNLPVLEKYGQDLAYAVDQVVLQESLTGSWAMRVEELTIAIGKLSGAFNFMTLFDEAVQGYSAFNDEIERMFVLFGGGLAPGTDPAGFAELLTGSIISLGVEMSRVPVDSEAWRLLNAEWMESRQSLTDLATMYPEVLQYLQDHAVYGQDLTWMLIEETVATDALSVSTKRVIKSTGESAAAVDGMGESAGKAFTKLNMYDDKIFDIAQRAIPPGLLDESLAEIDVALVKMDEYQTIINNLEDRKIEIKIKMAADIAIQEGRIANFDDIIKTLTRGLGAGGHLVEYTIPIETKIGTETVIEQIKQLRYEAESGIDFYKIAQSLAELTGGSLALTIQWEDMLAVMFQDYTLFEQDMKTATETIDQLLYFDIDLDTTFADEQINAMIFQWQSYIDGLSPGSQAQIDAQAGLNSLITKFTEMGGIVDEDMAIEFNIEQAELAAAEAEGLIVGIRTTAEGEIAQIDLDISAAQKAFNDLALVIQGIVDMLLETYGITIDVPDIPPIYIDVRPRYSSEWNPGDDPGIPSAPAMAEGGSLASTGLILAHAGETVIRPAGTQKFGTANMEAFNRTLDPSVLGGQQGRQYREQDSGKISVEIREANRHTYARVYKEKINQSKEYVERQNSASGSPF